ncbi:MAG: hypothetical protein ACK4SS_09140 [Cypionkella sp.]
MIWTSDDAALAAGGHTSGQWQAAGVSIDTRTLVAGDLFIALKAARDGHEFVTAALAKGAAGALVSHVPQGLAPDDPRLLIVPDVQAGLEGLARFARDISADLITASIRSIEVLGTIQADAAVKTALDACRHKKQQGSHR